MKTIDEKIKSRKEEFTPGNLVEKRTHPCFGQLQISRIDSSNTQLYGSSISHRHMVALRVYPSEQMIDGQHEWYFNKNLPHIEVWMSSTQFAEAITTLNSGCGTPCTITQLGGDQIVTPEFESKKEIHSRNFKERMESYSKNLKKLYADVKETFKKNTISKKDKEDLLNKINYAVIELCSNIPFFERQFQEQMDNTIKEAKGEVDAFVTGTLIKMGMEKLEEHKKLIEIEDKTDE